MKAQLYLVLTSMPKGEIVELGIVIDVKGINELGNGIEFLNPL